MIMFIKFFFLLLSVSLLSARSVHRPYDPNLPAIAAHWGDDTTHVYTLQESHLNQNLFIHFDKNYFFNHLLPYHAIHFRYDPSRFVSGAILSALVENLIVQIQQLKPNHRPHSFKHFTILKMSDVDFRYHTGLYILKFNDYPFIVKLYIEKPESFVQPTEKGFVPLCFFYLAGTTRHITGLTRIKNLEKIKKWIENHPYWKDKLDFPRKWFWIPKNPQWITVHGDNIGPGHTISMTIPAIYAVICDEIIWSRPFTMSNPEDKITVINLSNYLHQQIDLHINNFGVEKGTNKITPIDFESFPSAVCLNLEKTRCRGYFTWYSRLSCTALKRMLFRNKEERREAQYRSYECYII